MRIGIYGAQGIALGAYNAIKILYPEIEIECFLVTNVENNATMLGGIPVRELREFVVNKTIEEKKNIKVLIGTPENVMLAIEKSLDEVGLYDHDRLDSMKWADLQEKLFIKMGRFSPLSTYLISGKKPVIEVYKMIHHKDKALSSDYNLPEYYIPIQVGAALADVQISELADNSRDGISERNGDYSELTGVYWVWKNRIKQENSSERKYYGVAHYRRFLDLAENDLRRLCSNDIDVVLPYPMPYEPDIEAHHKRYLSEHEWQGVLQALEELEPEHIQEYKAVLSQGYMYNYNVIVAKAEVLDKYCEWLFSLLFRIEAINNPDGTKEPNRYLGYVGETLETLYFMSNLDRLKIAHTGCRFLV